MKPISSGIRTNLMIATNRRTYHLELESVSSGYMAALSWWYPADELVGLTARNDRAIAREAGSIGRGLTLEGLNFDYRMNGYNPAWKPVRVFDDGRHFFIQMPNSIIATDLPPLFVVGDAKQSIYSFQGAAPDAFGEKHDRFTEALSSQGLTLATQALHHSFRSAPAGRDVGDATFAGHSGGGFGTDIEHRAFFPDLPGRVDLWPALPPAERDTEERAWDDPLDRVAPDDPAAVLAREIAATVRGWIDTGETLPLPDGPRRPQTAWPQSKTGNPARHPKHEGAPRRRGCL